MSSLPGTNTTKPYLRERLPCLDASHSSEVLLGLYRSDDENEPARSYLSGFPFTLPFAIRKRVIHPDYFIPDAETSSI